MTPAAAATCVNQIVCENELPGTPQSVWDLAPGQGQTMDGFADPLSVNIGGAINFKVESPAAFSIDIYRMGYYGGDGARLVTSISANASVSEHQPACNTNTVTGLVDCGNWGISATWTVPTTAISGVYFARIYSADDANQIPFVVTNNASTSNIVFMTSDETWEAYNDWGGYSLYVGNATGSPWCCGAQNPGRAVQVSYNRPFNTRYETTGSAQGQDFFFSNEWPMTQFLEENGYDVSYVSQSNVSASGGAAMLEQHKVLMAAGHSEYFDAGDMTNITAARNAGVSLAFFSGNLMWWKTRWANSSFGNEPFRTLISYKESLDSAQSDPGDPPTWTGEWRDPRFSPPGDGGQPENALSGQLWLVNCCSYADQVQSAYAKLALWKNTAVANLQPGQTYTMPAETLGYEWDSDVDNGFRPAGEIDMSKTCESNVADVLQDPREDFATTTACNSLTLYRAAGGSLVFDAGTVQWAWGLVGQHDGDTPAPDHVMQQATVNLMAMMGVQPASLMTGLAAAAAPADSAPPTSTITAPAAGATLASGSTVTIGGTATDSGGGVVAGVEVSTDSGSTWHPVTTMSAAATSVTWSYTWSAAGQGPVTILSRATDDDANTETPGSGVKVTVNCPCGLFGNNYTPSVTAASDPTDYELGMKFESSVAGWVAGVQFYKGAGNSGTHTGSLWTASGTLLATGTFTNETASGWQSMTFLNPVQVTPNTVYVVSYNDPNGHYAIDGDLFDWPLNTPPLTAPKALYTSSTGGNGVFNAGGPGFPAATSNGSSYAVDVIFDTTQPAGAPPTVNSVTPLAGSTSNPVSVDPTATFSTAMASSTLSFALNGPGGSPVAGSASLNSANSVATFTPTSALAANTTYTATVSGQDIAGQALAAPYTYSFTTSKAFDSGGQCPCAIWPDVAPTAATDANDPQSVNLGVQFQPAANGTISAIRFYKEPDNTGAHTGTLWTATGTLLATGTFTKESSAGWQELDFTTPVSVTAGTTYVASYSTTVGHYAVSSGALSSAVTDGPLTALANGGVFGYGPSATFPSNSFQGSNYWVDVVYQQTADSSPPTVTANTPGTSATSVPVGSAPTATFSKAIQAGSATFTLTAPGGATVAGTTSLSSSGAVLTFTPTSQLSAGTVYQASVSGARGTNGVAMTAPDTWSFTTAGASACPCTIWESDVAPAIPAVNDAAPVELGVKFAVQTSGWIYGVRFYKGSGNTGTHTGSLWTDTGTLLAHGTFSNETASGWQILEFPAAVAVSAGQTYVASYFAPNGDYAATNGYFASGPVTNAPLQALQDGTDGGDGVFAYGGDQFPSSTFESANYWVDPVLYTSPPPNAQQPGQCPCTIWPNTIVPAVTSANDPSSVNLGVQFTASQNGWITGIRFYKGAANTGTHVGSLWDTAGDLLGQVTFTGETASGWQQATFSTPIAVTAGTSYVASYLAPRGGYAVNSGGLSSAVTNGPLTALAGGGVYAYGSSSTLPTGSYQASNYWVDVVFTTTAP
ncbi:MAG TPA: DUF4082 domain-containing protein [Streptosporangiaceae bacterium]